MHNYYTQLYNAAVFDLLKKEKGTNEAVLFARSATAGGQQFPVHWGGDCDSTYLSMAESLRGGLSLTLSGFGFWSHDISGFENTAPAHVYKRWVAFGLLSTHSRLHGSSSYRVPWLFDDESVNVLRHFSNLKNKLMPYIYSTAVETSQTGVPSMRATLLEFENDPACLELDAQYMFGKSLLVAPIFKESGEVSYYLPKGTWTHLLSGEIVEGGSWRTETYDFFSLPLFVRENTLLPIGADKDNAVYNYEDGLQLHLYQLKDGQKAETVVCDNNGETFLKAEAVRSGDTVTVTLDGANPEVVLVGINEVKDVTGAETGINEKGVCLKPTGSSVSFTLN